MYKEFWDRLEADGLFNLVSMQGWSSVNGSPREDYSPKDVIKYLLDEGDSFKYPDWREAAITILFAMGNEIGDRQGDNGNSLPSGS
jgi:hypothetical protein